MNTSITQPNKVKVIRLSLRYIVFELIPMGLVQNPKISLFKQVPL